MAYQQSEQINEELINTVSPETLKTIVTYEVNASDLKYYEKQNEYVKGKQDPFEAYSEAAAENTTTNGSSSGTNNNGGTLNPNENK